MFLAAIAGVGALFSAAQGLAAELTADEIMEKFVSQFRVADETAKLILTLIDKQGKERSDSFTLTSKRYPGNLYKTVMRFTAPETVSGTGVLIVENRDRGNDLWFYLPTLKKTKRISSSEHSQSFMGSEIAYEEFESEEPSDFHYERKGSEVVDGRPCFIIEAVASSPHQQEQTGYSKRLLWIDEQDFLKRKVEYYDKVGRLLKTERDEEIVPVAGGRYRINKGTYVNHQTGRSTVLRCLSRSLETGVSDSLFTISSLEHGA
jgi:uncharacterized protein